MNDSPSTPFGTETPDASAAATVSARSWVSVEEMLAHQVTIHWPEAVAVAAELCAVLLGRASSLIPQAADVLVNGDGELSIRAEDGGEPDPAAIGRLLHTLIGAAPTPAALRLFVSHAMTPERYPSVSAFAEALAAHEVAGRNKLIQAVHRRWTASRAEATPAVSVPLRPGPEQEKKPPVKPAGARRVPRWAIATMGLAAVSAGAAGAWVAAGAQPLSIPSLSLTVPAAIHDAWAWLDARRSGDKAAAEPEATESRARTAKPRTSAPRRRTSDRVPDAAVAAGPTDATPESGSADPRFTAVGTEPVTVALPVGDDTPATAAAMSPAGAATGATPATPRDVTLDADATVYSSAYAGVVPPVMMTRQITPPAVRTSGVEAVSTIELLVDETGRVERARLMSRPSPILAAMLLSAAKTWTFKPASNDGRAVKYRLLLDVTTTQP